MFPLNPFPLFLTVLLSELILDRDLAIIPSRRSHYHATSINLSSTSFALGHFGYRLIACPLFF